MQIRRLAARLHKWIALLIGVQVMLWIAGGLVMSAFPIEQVRGEHRMRENGPLQLLPGTLVSLDAAAQAAGFARIDAVELTNFLGRPAYVLSSGAARALVSATDGVRLSPVDASTARALAEADYSGKGAVQEPEWIIAPGIEYRRAGPVWRVAFDGPGGESTYIDPYTGKITARRSDLWRVYDFFWMLHIMDYKERDNSHHPLLVAASGAGLVFAISGLALLTIRMRMALNQQLKAGRKTPVS